MCFDIGAVANFAAASLFCVIFSRRRARRDGNRGHIHHDVQDDVHVPSPRDDCTAHRPGIRPRMRRETEVLLYL
jgi:hypothetical protein